tara:strand:- start:3 stop:986 length:984 start_codon:yes stop_codon:yes gene_type:complete
MIDYNKDIATLYQNYFPTLVGERGFDQSMDFHNKVLMPMQQQTMKLEQDNLAFKRQKLAFRKQRNELRMEREANKSIPMIDNRLREIRTSETTPMEKREAFTDFAMNNIGLINTNPTISSLFSYQDKLLESQMASDAKLRQNEMKIRNTAANDYRQGTLRTGLYDENVYKGVLAGDVSDQQVSDILSKIARAKELEEEASKKKDSPDFTKEAAEDTIKRLQSVSFDEKPVMDSDGKVTRDVYLALDTADYDEFIDDLVRLRGEPLKSGRAQATADFPLEKSRELIQEIRDIAYTRIDFSQLGQDSLTTPKADEERDNVTSAFFGQPD